MRIMIAPDKFKGVISAAEAAAAIERGIHRTRPDAMTTLCPLADGGEGTVAAMVAATGGCFAHARVTGPLPGTSINAEYGLLGDGHTAVIEMAAASGLALLHDDSQRNPMQTTSYGTGELIAAAQRLGVNRIILGIGGSASTDAGVGALQALGMQVRLDDGTILARPFVGEDLARVQMLIPPDNWGMPEILIACDVENPLYGPEGAARIFGPQKGATNEDVEKLDTWLAVLAHKTGTESIARMNGSGAAGGLGYGLCAFLPQTRLSSGFGLIAQACGFAAKLEGMDLCITAEGRLDCSSLKGKTAVGVARVCRAARIPCVVLAGSVEREAEELLRIQTNSPVFSIVDGPRSLDYAISRTVEFLERAAARLVMFSGSGNIVR